MTQPDQIVTETPHITETFRGGSLSLREVQKSFGTARVLNGVSFDVASGQVVCMIGPSGSGKSTALRCINRLEEPTGGDILLDGESTLTMSADKLRHRVGMVFQQFNLFPHRTVLDNITLPLRKVAGGTGARPCRARTGRSGRQGRVPARSALRRPATASRDRPRLGHAAGGDAVRRGHQRVGPRAGQGGPAADG
jgi:polar amino acid transport system ATP-binding protein